MKRTGLHLKKAVFVEAISDDPLRESKWVVDVSSRPEAKGVQHAFVFNAPLHRPDVENLLKEYAKNPSIVGIRQIVNHHPTNPNLTWPKIDQDFLKNEQWKKNFSLLARYNFSFDLQLNPHQMKTAAEIISRNPEIPVIVDHLGTLFLGNSDEENKRSIETWREGMKALSLLPNVTVKLSMLGFTKAGWEKNAESKKIILGFVHETIQLFGTKRCMFGSNFPVDAVGSTPEDLYGSFREISSNLTSDQQHDLFYATADRVYFGKKRSKI